MSESDTQDRVTRYRAIGVAEKRQQLEAAGEAWPVGSDGLPKVWHPGARQAAGGSWQLRSSARAASQRHNRSENKGAARAQYEESRIRLRFAGSRTSYRIAVGKKQEIQERLAAFKEHQARTRQEARENGWID